MNILITSAGRRVALTKAFQKELGLLFPESEVYCTDANPQMSAACRIAHKSFQVPRLNHPGYIDFLLKLCLENNVRMLVPTLDTELILLSENKKLFQEHSIEIIISDIKLIGICRDKRLVNHLFEQHNISFPRPISKENPTFPLFIKPYDGSLSSDIYIVKGKEDLREYHLINDRLIFMEYFDKSVFDEYTVDMYYDKNHTLISAVPRKRIEIRGGEISKGLTLKNHVLDFLRERLATLEGALGCITLQLFHHPIENRIIGIEINPRFGGGYPLSYYAEANFPKNLIEEYFLGKKLAYNENWLENTLMLRYDDEVIVKDFRP